MSIFNGNSLFLSKKSKTMPVVKVPKNVKQSLQIDRAFENGIFKIEPKEKWRFMTDAISLKILITSTRISENRTIFL